MKTPRQQFDEAIEFHLENDIQTDKLLNECESISDSMAIEFARWIGIESWCMIFNGDDDKPFGLWSNGYEELNNAALLYRFKQEFYREGGR